MTPTDGADRRAPGQRPVFAYDFNSPYAYLAATRVDRVLPVTARWQPVALAFMLRAHDRRPWSLREGQRERGMAQCARRAEAYGLPALRWPPGWPVESYTLLSLRAALVADEHGLLRAFSHAAFARNFVHGLGLSRMADVLAVAEEVGLDGDAVERRVGTREIKDRLAAATDAALGAGAVGVPTLIAGTSVFWGDDQLEAAAAAVGG